jgi:hypothetical protein
LVGQVIAAVDFRSVRGDTGGWASERIMRLFRTRFHAYVALVFLACLLITGIVILLPRERVTRANFERIEIGMSVADVQTLLGRRPEVQAVDSGRVLGPSSYSVDLGPKRLHRDGYQNYTRQQWSSPELTINVISDANGRIVCRYSHEGQRRPSVFDIVRFWLFRHF